MNTPKCAECRNGEIDEAATKRVTRPNDEHPGLKVTEWVCDEHYQMLLDDYGAALRDVHAAIAKAGG